MVGAVVGTAHFDWETSGSSILPGAICEHLTSFGGNLNANATQTPLTEFLRHGAAGASGTVTEPYAIQAKFPTPLMHVSYLQGCSLAESFYQSVAGPYQLLIVGDPLCQPWADTPVVTVGGLEAGEVVSDQRILRASATAKSGVQRLELFLDGKRVGEFGGRATIPIDTRTMWDGPHELRVVAIAKGRVESQGRAIIPFEVANGNKQGEAPPWTPELPSDQIVFGDDVTIQLPDTFRDDLRLYSGARLIAHASKDGNVTIPTRMLGSGQFDLRMVSSESGKQRTENQFRLKVRPISIPPLDESPTTKTLRPGIEATIGRTTRRISELTKQLPDVEEDSKFQLTTYVEAKDGVHQFRIRPKSGVSTITLNGQSVSRLPNRPMVQYPVRLEDGWYKLVITGRLVGEQLPDIRMGRTTIRRLTSENCFVAAKEK